MFAYYYFRIRTITVFPLLNFQNMIFTHPMFPI